MYLACADYAGASTYIVSKETMKKCLFNPDSNLSFKECCLKNAPVSPTDLDYGNYTHSEDKKWCNAIGAIYTSGSIPKCECKIKINSTTTKQFSWDSMGTCSVKTSTTNGEITQTKEFFEECLRTLLNEHFFNNMITPLTTLSNVTKLNCSAITDSGGGNGGETGGGTGGENPTPPENPPTPPAQPTLTPEQECTAAGKIWDATNEKCMTQEEKACIDAKGIWDGTECDPNVSESRWGALWNHQTMTFDCMNAIEYADYKLRMNKISQQTHRQIYETWYNIIYDENNNTTPMNSDLKWYVKPDDNKYPNTTVAKCASFNERQCYQSGGWFDWFYDNFKTGKCYTHSGDKTWCEAIGARFTTQNGLSACDCKIKNTTLEFHWKSTVSCDWKQGDSLNSGYGTAGDFFERCLKENLKDSPIFNGNLYTTTGGLFNQQTVLKKLNCK